MSGIETVFFAMAAAKAMTSIMQGQAAHAAARAEARQLSAEANRAEALSQREAIEQRRQSRLVASRALAIAGASGAGVDDPSVVNVLDEIDAQGEFNMLSALYDGKIKANTLRFQADQRREEGRAARKAGYITALADMGTSLYSGGAFTNEGLFGMKGTATATKYEPFSMEGIGVDWTKTRKKIRSGSDAAINAAIGLK